VFVVINTWKGTQDDTTGPEVGVGENAGENPLPKHPGGASLTHFSLTTTRFWGIALLKPAKHKMIGIA
jgi:hypothetical protein